MNGADLSDLRFVDEELRGLVKPDAWFARQRYDHPCVPVGVADEIVAIDKEIAELVYLLWKNGIRTESSCQDLNSWRRLGAEEHPMAKSMIDFVSMDDIATFMTIVAPEDGVPGGIWDRATGGNVDIEHPGIWEWLFFPKMEGRRAVLGAGAVFPLSDVPELVERLRRGQIS